MQLPSSMFIEEVLRNETILALQGRQLDPISALRQAEDIFNYSGALRPPENATFRLVRFTGREQQYHNRIYIRFEYPAPDPPMSPGIDRDCLETWNSLTVVLLRRNLLSSNFGTCDFTFFFVCVSFSN